MTPALDLQACAASAFQATPDMALRSAICAGLLGVGGWASARRRFPGKGSFLAMVLVMAGWIAFSISEHSAVDAACKATLGIAAWAAALPQPALLALFLYQHLNSEPHSPPMPVRVLMATPIVLLILLAWTNGEHGLFYGPKTALGPPILGLPRLRYDYGPFFYVTVALGYFWLTTAVVLTLRGWRFAPPSQRGVRATFLLMMAIPLIANASYIGLGVRLFGADPTSTAFAFCVVGFAWMISRNRIFAVVPMARERLFAELPDPVLVLDVDGRVVEANVAAQRLLGAAAPLGAPLDEWPRIGAALLRHGADGVPGALLELDQPRAIFEVQRRALGTAERPIGTLLQLHDVTTRELAHHETARALAAREVELDRATALQALLREQAMRDPLTGLLNRRALEERFAQERKLGVPRPFSLVLLDLDHFKRVNDTHGHPAGDAVLRDFAAVLRSGLRASDALFRVGGEEFAVWMPQAGIEVATQRVEALRALVASWRLGGLSEPVTFSAGVVQSPSQGALLEDMLAAADKALYRAKQSGRDRIEVVLAVP